MKELQSFTKVSFEMSLNWNERFVSRRDFRFLAQFSKQRETFPVSRVTGRLWLLN